MDFGVTAKANVLIVDDEPHSLAAMCHLLEGPDRNVVAVESGMEALRQVLKTEFALIVLDVRMPGLDGIETAVAIRERRQSRHTPIMFLTAALDDMESMFRGYEVGAVDYLLKPVDPNILRSKVAVFVELHAKSAALARQAIALQSAERELSSVNESLEQQIRERTASLVAANEMLRLEVEMRRQAEEESRAAKQLAEAANRAKSAFLANMSHEIRTPMNAMIGMTEVALRTELTPQQREYLTLARAAGEALLNVVNDVLDFSKIEAGAMPLEAIVFSLRETVGEAMKTLAVSAHEKSLELAYDIAPDVPDRLVGDPVRLRQVIGNLVGNAIKFTECGDVVVTVSLESRGDGEAVAHFAVRDTGVGVAPDKQDLIFAPFLQADTSTTRLYGGTGLGLTISARLVEMMNGRIWVESEPGRGSTFHFTAAFGVETIEAPAPEATDFRSLRVLVVEDHAPSRQALANMLRQWQVRFDEADNGLRAQGEIARAVEAEQPYRLVLLDGNLADPGVAAIVETIRQTQRAGAPPCAVTLLNGCADGEPGGRHPGSGALSRVTKPMTHAELLAALRAAGDVEAPSAAELAASAAGARRTILLVEDNPMNRRLAQIVLEGEGHRVILAENGGMAVEAFATTPVDLILMDVQMPRMDGIETTARIRERERATGGHVPIIALTAHAVAGDRERFLAAGMDGYLTKPLKPARLLEAVAALPVPAKAAPVRTGGMVLDRGALLERVDGDPQLVEEIAQLFEDNVGRLMADVRETLVQGQRERYNDALHTLTGMFRNLAADGARDLAQQLRGIDVAQDGAAAGAILQELEKEIEAVKAELRSLVRATTIVDAAFERRDPPAAMRPAV